MKKSNLLLISLTIMMFCGYASAKIYYIDFSTGLDKASGTSKTAPWKLHPFMNGFSGAYTHAIGDTFYFKGGVIWPASCFYMSISASGTTTKPDYYGADVSWFTGTSFTKPIFDAQQTVLAKGQKIIDISNDSNIIIDKLEIRGLLVNTNNNFMLGSISSYNSQYITIKNCYIHDWSISSACSQDGMFGGIIFNNPMTTAPGIGNVIDSCTITDSAQGGTSGYGVRCVETIKNCNIHHVPNGILGSSRFVHGNTVHDIHLSFDPSQHENGIYVFGWNNAAGPTYIYNNIIYNVDVMSLYVSPGWNIGGTKGIAYIYNNLLYANSRGIEIDPEQATAQTVMYAYIYNNTVVGNIRVTPRSGLPAIKKLVMINNHYIYDLPSSSKTAACYNAPPNGGAVDTAVDSNNLIMSTSVASSTGYTLKNRYGPISGTSYTVDKGIPETSLFKTDSRDTLRPKGKSWDIGAFEWVPSASSTIEPLPGNSIAPSKKSGTLIINRVFSNEQNKEGVFTLLGARCSNPMPASNIYFLKDKTGSLSKATVNR